MTYANTALSADDYALEIMCGQHNDMCCLLNPWTDCIFTAPPGAVIADVFMSLQARFGARLDHLLRRICEPCAATGACPAPREGAPIVKIDIGEATFEDLEYAVIVCGALSALRCLCGPVLQTARAWRNLGALYPLLRLACQCGIRPPAAPPPVVTPPPVLPPPPPMSSPTPPPPAPPAAPPGCALPPPGQFGTGATMPLPNRGVAT